MQHSDEKIEHTEKILSSFWWLIKIFFIELWDEIRDFFITMKRNFIWQKITRKVATIVFASLIVIPAWFSYYSSANSLYTYVENRIMFDQNIKVLQSSYEKSVRSFFQVYNQKYGTDCEWIKKVNVDMNMAQLWTERKPGRSCSLNTRVQIFPITVENPIADGEQLARINGKALYVILNGNQIQNVWYQRYELWRKMEWDIADWKFNPFPQDDKERLK